MNKKVLLTIFFSTLGTTLTALMLCRYVFIPEQTKYFIDVAWEYANKPLPILGVSSVVVAFFLWKIFMSTSFGKKKYNELKEKLAKLLELLNKSDEEIKKQQERYEKLEAKYIALLNYTNEIKHAIPNKKVKQIAEIKQDEEERKETVND